MTEQWSALNNERGVACCEVIVAIESRGLRVGLGASDPRDPRDATAIPTENIAKNTSAARNRSATSDPH